MLDAPAVLLRWSDGGTHAWQIKINETGEVLLEFENANGVQVLEAGLGAAFSAGEWYNVEAGFDAATGAATLTLDGASPETGSLSNWTPGTMAPAFQLGGIDNGSNDTEFRLDAVKLYRGYGTADTFEDPDQDGLANYDEYLIETNPTLEDTDDDGMPDGWEWENGTDALSGDAGADPDGDGLSNLAEYLAQTDPGSADTDDDGVADHVEIALGRNPRQPPVADATDHPVTGLQVFRP